MGRPHSVACTRTAKAHSDEVDLEHYTQYVVGAKDMEWSVRCMHVSETSGILRLEPHGPSTDWNSECLYSYSD